MGLYKLCIFFLLNYLIQLNFGNLLMLSVIWSELFKIIFKKHISKGILYLNYLYLLEILLISEIGSLLEVS